MPGSIHVSVLEAFNLPERISDDEDVAIKVVVGTREYQTVPSKAVGGRTAPWASDFVFPVLNLRDNLLVILLDKNGETISKSEIDTPSIVEQGSFDVNLLLNGGGNVHLGLSFVLTEEERRRIDVMRAAALKRREQEALKRSLSTQSLPVEAEVEIGSFGDHSTAAESLEREIEKAGVAKDSSASVAQEQSNSQAIHEQSFVCPEPTGKLDSVTSEEPETNLHGNVEGVSERYSNPSDKAGKNNKFINVDNGNQEPTEFSDLALVDDSGQAAIDQAASETDSEGQTIADLDKNDMLQHASEENKGSVDEPSDTKLKSTSSSVKARIKAFEKTRPQGATKQNPTLSSSSSIQKLSPHDKTTARKKAEGDAGQIAKVNQPLDDLEVVRTRNKTSEPANQIKNAHQYRNVLTRSEAALETSEAEYTSTKENCEIPMTRSEDDGLQHATEGERPKHYKDKSPSMQKSRNFNLVSLSKQVLSGAISGAVLVAAVALLWAVNPKRRNSRLPQKSKQRKRK